MIKKPPGAQRERMPDKVKWGIIGCGDVTEVKSGPAFAKCRGSELVAVMRRDENKVRDYARRHSVPHWFTDADALIHHPDVNAVYVATPPYAHADYAIKALNAGKPVYVEKPMALNFTECEQMIEAAEQAGTPLFVAYYRRALPGFLKIKELIDSGAIGQVRLIDIQLYKSSPRDAFSGDLPWRVKPEISGGGLFFDLASHQLDYLDHVFGPVQDIRSLAINQAGWYLAEDFVQATLRFKHNVVCSGTWCFTASPAANRDVMTIIGDEGMIEFSCFGFVPVRLTTGSGTQEFDYPKPEHVQQYLIQQIVDELSGNGKCVSTGTSGARTSLVMDNIVAEYYRK